MKNRGKKRVFSKSVNRDINKKLMTGEFIVLGIFVVAIFLLVVFGNRLTGLGLTGFAISDNYESMEKLEIQVKNTYYPGDDVNFKIILYDENTNKIDGEIDYEIKNYYTEIIDQGKVNSGQEKIFKLPENAIRGHWAVVARYGNIEKKELFTVQELERAEIRLELNLEEIQDITSRASTNDICYLGIQFHEAFERYNEDSIQKIVLGSLR